MKHSQALQDLNSITDPNGLFEPVPSGSTDFMQKLPGLLRLLGAGVLLIAMYSFLVKGWQNGNDTVRYLMMLGHTGVLAATGLASGHWLKDGKGARLLLTLALASVPANFAILGAFIFGQTSAVDISLYPHYFSWTAGGVSTVLTTSVAMLVLIPLTYLGFTVLARGMSKRATIVFLISNAALLLPLRDPQLVALMVLILAVFSVYFTATSSHLQTAVKTREGMTALGMLYLPLAVLMLRSLWLYSADYFLLAVLSVSAFMLLRQASQLLESGSSMQKSLNAISLLPAFIVIPFLSTALFESVASVRSLALPIAALLSATMIFDISRRSLSFSSGYRNIAVGLLMLNAISNLLLLSNTPAAMVCIFFGLGLLVAGYRKQYRYAFNGGGVLLLTGAFYQAYELVHHFELVNWFSMAVFGVLVIVLASAIESQGGRILSTFNQWLLSYKSWQK